MGDHQGRLGTVNLGRSSCGLKSVTDRLYSRYRADKDIKRILTNESCSPLPCPLQFKARCCLLFNTWSYRVPCNSKHVAVSCSPPGPTMSLVIQNTLLSPVLHLVLPSPCNSKYVTVSCSPPGPTMSPAVHNTLMILQSYRLH